MKKIPLVLWRVKGPKHKANPFSFVEGFCRPKHEENPFSFVEGPKHKEKPFSFVEGFCRPKHKKNPFSFVEGPKHKENPFSFVGYLFSAGVPILWHNRGGRGVRDYETKYIQIGFI